MSDMEEIAVGIVDANGGLRTYHRWDTNLRDLVLQPGFLNGDMSSVSSHVYGGHGDFHVPTEHGYIIFHEKTKTITQWGYRPRLDEVTANLLGVHEFRNTLQRGTMEDKLLSIVDEKLRGADFGGVRPSRLREELRPFIGGATYYADLNADGVTVDFPPLQTDVQLVRKIKELSWTGKRREWLHRDEPNFVDLAITFPGWTLNKIAYEDMAEFKRYVDTLVELDEDELEVWQRIADKRYYELEPTGMQI
jgi:hypothetical protein